MARVLFKIEDWCGGDREAAQRAYAPHWDLLRLCEEAGLYQREAEAVIGHVMGCTNAQISQVTGMELTHVRPALDRGVKRIAKALGPRHSTGNLEAWAILLAFRNRRSWPDHGPQLSGTANRGYREVYPPQVVTVDDLVHAADPVLDDLAAWLRRD
jgi:hypothetical protein